MATRRDSVETAIGISIGAVFGVIVLIGWLEYAEWRDETERANRPKCDDARVRVCDAPDYFYRYSGEP